MFAAQQNYFNLYVVGELSVSSSAGALGIETCLFFPSFFFLIPNKCTRLLSEQVCLEHDSPKICVGHCSCNTFYSIVCISHLQATHVFQNKFVFSCNEAISDCEGVGLFSLQHNV